MNEEEKKAICELKNYISRRKLKYTKLDRHDKAIDNLLNLITNIQKENEELKNDYENLNNSVVVKNYCIKNSIPVQKVKDKIDEILNNGEYRIIFEGDAEFPDSTTETTFEKYINLKVLDKLLERRE